MYLQRAWPLFIAACAPSHGDWIVRLDRATLPQRMCDGSEWNSDEENLPNPSVRLVANSTGTDWQSEVIDDELEPAWGVAAFDGAALTGKELEEFGLGISVLEGSGLFEDEVAHTSVLVADDAFDTGVLLIDVECIEVDLSLIRP